MNDGYGPGVLIPPELQAEFEAIKDAPIVYGRPFRVMADIYGVHCEAPRISARLHDGTIVEMTGCEWEIYEKFFKRYSR